MSRKPQLLDVPEATRNSTSGWRDPRLWVGVVLVAGSVVVGATVLSPADSSVQVWAMARDYAPGEPVDVNHLVATRVSFDASTNLDRYLRVDDELPEEHFALRALSAGELVPRAALGARETTGLVEVPLVVAAAQVPGSVGTGSVVDVWVVSQGEKGKPRAEEVLADVRVLDAPRSDDSFGAVTTDRQLVLGVPEWNPIGIGSVLAASGEDSVRIVVGGAEQ